MTNVCVKMCSEPIVLLSAHLHPHVRHTGHCTFTCTWCVHVNVQWFDCPMCSCKWTVSPMADVCIKMCTEPFVWLSAHLHAHVRYTRHFTFTCNWCMPVNVQLFDCLMCSIIGQWAQLPMCSWKCAVSQLSDSLHIYMHTSDTRVTARLRACKRTVILPSDVFDNWAVSAMTDVSMKMCSEPIVWLSAHLHAHVTHSGHCTFTCTWCVLLNVQWSDCLMCSIIGQWARWSMCAWKCRVSQLPNSLHIYMHTSDTRVTVRFHAPDVCL